jgi:hypothetical protein
VDKNVRAAIALLGAWSASWPKAASVVVKPNVLTGRPPEYATTSSPELVQAVIAMCWEAGAKEVTVLDNPTSEPGPLSRPQTRQAVAAADATLAYLSGRDYQEYDIPQGKVLEKWEFVTEAMEADTLIDLALPKQHSTSGATMTMKNLMGVMGGRRGSIHSKFAQKIVDVNTLVKPTLSILDGYRVLFPQRATGGSWTTSVSTSPGGRVQHRLGRRLWRRLLRQDGRRLPWLVEAAARGMCEIDVSKLAHRGGSRLVARRAPAAAPAQRPAQPRRQRRRRPARPLSVHRFPGYSSCSSCCCCGAADVRVLAGLLRAGERLPAGRSLDRPELRSPRILPLEMLLAVPVILSPLFLGGSSAATSVPWGS